MKVKVGECISGISINDVQSVLEKTILMLTFLLEKEIIVVVEQNKFSGFDIYLETKN